jgi:uncharacterized protein (TIGR02391 family)
MSFMDFFPPTPDIMQMEPDELGPFVPRYMMVQHAMTNRFNFGQAVPNGQISNRFMEAWAWLERQGFIARRANDQFDNDFFVTRAGAALTTEDDMESYRQANIFPAGMDSEIERSDTAVFRAFKEVEVRVRKKSGLKNEYGRALIQKAFGETGPLMKDNRDDRASARELFAGAIGFCKNPSSHHEIKFEDPREVVDMICFANQLFRIIDRITL